MMRADRHAVGEDPRARRREVGRVLTEAGLLGGPRGKAVADEPFARRLRAALEWLGGPVFASFGLYLSSRVDLLAPQDCLELAGIQDRDAPLPAGEVLALVAADLGRPLPEVFAAFDEIPRESRLLTQSHAARLVNGDMVVVRAVRPNAAAAAGLDLPLLASQASDLARGGPEGALLAEAVAGFQEALPGSLDLTAEAAGLQALALDASDPSPLRVARLHPGLSGPRVLVREDLAGVPWSGAAGEGAVDLARRLCLLWLHLALRGQIVPVEPRPANLEVLPGGRIAFTGGAFARLPPASQVNLWEYFGAAARRDPDQACSRLLREMTPAGPDASEERLRLRLRQAVPFRDGGWGEAGESLAEELFLHWRFAHECGFRPRPHLLACWRGLAAVSIAARGAAPGPDVLARSLEELRLTASLEQMGELADPRRLGETLERYLVLMADLPQQLDEALTRAARAADSSIEEPGAAPAGRPKASSAPLAAALLALAAVVLLARQLGGGVWGERIGALCFLAVGALLLRRIGSW